MFEIGIAIFFGVHLIPFIASLRNFFSNKFGENLYKSLFSLFSLMGLFLISFGYQSNSDFLYSINGTVYSYSKYIMFISFPLIVATNMPTYIKKYIKHPMSVGVGIWAIMHLMLNPDLASVILFGSFLVYSIVSAVMSEFRSVKTSVENPKIIFDFLSVGIGVFLTFIAFHFHENLTGIALT